MTGVWSPATSYHSTAPTTSSTTTMTWQPSVSGVRTPPTSTVSPFAMKVRLPTAANAGGGGGGAGGTVSPALMSGGQVTASVSKCMSGTTTSTTTTTNPSTISGTTMNKLPLPPVTSHAYTSTISRPSSVPGIGSSVGTSPRRIIYHDDSSIKDTEYLMRCAFTTSGVEVKCIPLSFLCSYLRNPETVFARGRLESSDRPLSREKHTINFQLQQGKRKELTRVSRGEESSWRQCDAGAFQKRRCEDGEMRARQTKERNRRYKITELGVREVLGFNYGIVLP
ncbi:unnamed protein product, partial [Notodromas monacha]